MFRECLMFMGMSMVVGAYVAYDQGDEESARILVGAVIIGIVAPFAAACALYLYVSNLISLMTLGVTLDKMPLPLGDTRESVYFAYLLVAWTVLWLRGIFTLYYWIIPTGSTNRRDNEQIQEFTLARIRLAAWIIGTIAKIVVPFVLYSYVSYLISLMTLGVSFNKITTSNNGIIERLHFACLLTTWTAVWSRTVCILNGWNTTTDNTDSRDNEQIQEVRDLCVERNHQENASSSSDDDDERLDEALERSRAPDPLSSFIAEERQIIASEQEKEKELDHDDNNNNICVICIDRRSRVVLLPCRHLCMCTVCVRLISDQCPVCRGAVEDNIIVY